VSDPPRPPVFRRRPFAGIAAFAVLAMAFGTNVHSATNQGLLSSWLLLAISSVGFYLVFGLGGQFAFSQAAFYGLGAYTSAWATRPHLDHATGHYVGGHPYLVGLLAAVAVSAVVAFAFAVLVRKTDQFYFAITTLALSFMCLTVFQEWTGFSQGGDVSNIKPVSLAGLRVDTDLRKFGLLLAVLVVVLSLVALIERSPLRRDLISLRDNGRVAATLGVPTQRLRYLVFVLGSTIAAVAGSLYANTGGALTIDSFGVGLGIDIFLVVLLGGIGSMWGAVIGAAFVSWLPHKLGFVGDHEELVYGAVLIVVMTAAPKGLVGMLEAGWNKLRGGDRAVRDPGAATAHPAVVAGTDLEHADG
jgi:branched-chain amino acid transport system permease protein